MLFAYIITLFLVLPILLVHNKITKSKENKKQGYLNILVICYVILIFILVTGFRDIASVSKGLLSINDEYRYRLAFNSLINTPFSFSNVNSYEWARYVLDWTIANFFGDSQMWVFIYALITNILFVRTINKYVKPLWFGIFLFITVGLFTFQMNATTQLLAAAILSVSIGYVIKRKFFKFLLVLVVAAGFHTSAWLMLPLYFIITKKFLSKSILFSVFIGLILYAQFDLIAGFFLPSTSYDFYLNQIRSGESYGVNIFRVLCFIILFVFILVSKKRIDDLSVKDNFFINNITILLIINIVSIAYVYVSRLDVYFYISLIYMLPRTINLYSGRQKFFTLLIIVTAFFVFGLQQNWNLPYGNILTK